MALLPKREKRKNPLMLESEKQLVKRAQTDPNAFSMLYEENYSKIYAYILKRVANVELAQDITSETFFKALKNIKKFKWQKVPFSAWLYRIASNEIVNYFRKNKYAPMLLEHIPEAVSLSTPHTEIIEAEEELAQKKEFLELRDKISQLPDIYQEVITLKYFEKKKIKEIALILNKKEGTIKSLIYRGINKLKETFLTE